MEDSQPPVPDNFFKAACIFEGSLLVVAVILGWFADIDPFVYLVFSEQAVLYGLLGTAPLFIFFLALQVVKIEAFQRITRILLQTLGPMLQKCNWADLMILAAIAGIAEEVLFRGVLQPWLENSWGMNAGLVFSSIIFGMVHAVTPMYAILATLVSIYLGLSLDYAGERNLLTPVVIHATYDFLAFMFVRRVYQSIQQGADNEEN